ncbi:MAG: arsenate reductase/protein-tyrosine-phosphatase family protein [Promethearchaeota archaeon]
MVKEFPYKSILVACSVGVARSPMVCYFLKEFFDIFNIDVKVCYGGIASHARDNMLISMDAKLAMKEVGIEMSETAVSLDIKKHPIMIKDADLILTLTEKHKSEILRFDDAKDKEILTLKEFAGSCGDIEDPSMKELKGFRIVRDEILDCIMKGLNKYNF